MQGSYEKKSRLEKKREKKVTKELKREALKTHNIMAFWQRNHNLSLIFKANNQLGLLKLVSKSESNLLLPDIFVFPGFIPPQSQKKTDKSIMLLSVFFYKVQTLL